jgi:hypothetical protein
VLAAGRGLVPVRSPVPSPVNRSLSIKVESPALRNDGPEKAGHAVQGRRRQKASPDGAAFPPWRG